MLYTVYGLHEAGKPDEIEYVGCTSQLPQKRLSGHISASRNQLHRKRLYEAGIRTSAPFYPVNRWIVKLMSAGKQVLCRALMQTEDIVFAYQVEEEMIIYFADRGGPLHNVEGNPIPLQEALAACGESLRIVQARIADGSLDIQAFIYGNEN